MSQLNSFLEQPPFDTTQKIQILVQYQHTAASFHAPQVTQDELTHNVLCKDWTRDRGCDILGPGSDGQMMIVAFVGLVPFALFTAYTRKGLSATSRWWFQVHRAVNAAAWLLQLAAVAIKCVGMSMASVKQERPVLVHVCVGISLQIVIGVQVLIALLLRPSHDSGMRQSWNATHRWLGWLVALVALAQLAGGMLLAHRPVRDYWAVFGVLVFWYLAFLALDLWRASQLPLPGHAHMPGKAGRGGNGDIQLLGQRQELAQAAGDVPNVAGFQDAPEGAGFVAAAMGGGRRASRETRFAEV
ncbi:hypothetical protein WJX81_003798 [Elliptochloris bilobata]|uniref:Cytochrome b561 domain-containing protein n=1 Tax=Elliptochloris bilobata TaxID=381761 RepID=A0AAW1RQQ5_9CHLO